MTAQRCCTIGDTLQNEEKGGCCCDDMHQMGKKLWGRRNVFEFHASQTTLQTVNSPEKPQERLAATVEDVLLARYGCSLLMSVDQFLKNFAGGRRATCGSGKDPLDAFLRHPHDYLRDKGELEVVKGFHSFQIFKAACDLLSAGIFTMRQWVAVRHTFHVNMIARGILDAALEARETSAGHNSPRDEESDKMPDEGAPSELGRQSEVQRSVSARTTPPIQAESVSTKSEGEDTEVRQQETRRDVRLFMPISAPVVTEHPLRDVVLGAYESVYNAQLGYVLSGTVYMGEPLGMKVVQQPSVDEEPGLRPLAVAKRQVAPDGCNLASLLDAELQLVVLYSPQGWPHNRFDVLRENDRQRGATTTQNGTSMNNVYIRKEVMRTWHIVERGITTNGVTGGCRCHVVVGTSGAGKSCGVAPLLLYQLLHCNPEVVAVIAYFIGTEAYIFNKQNKTQEGVVRYRRQEDAMDDIISMSRSNVKGFVIYDTTNNPGDIFRIPQSWNIVVLSSSNTICSEKWVNWVRGRCICINCFEEVELKAVFAWEYSSRLPKGTYPTTDQMKCLKMEWEVLKERIDTVGPLPQYVWNAAQYRRRVQDVSNVLSRILSEDAAQCMRILDGLEECHEDETAQKLLKLVRIGNEENERHRYSPVSPYIKQWLTLVKHAECINQNEFYRTLSRKDDKRGYEFEMAGVLAFTVESIVDELIERIKYLPGASDSDACTSVLVHRNTRGRVPSSLFIFSPDHNNCAAVLDYLYKPLDHNFPLVDAFFFVRELQKATECSPHIPQVVEESRATVELFPTTIILLQPTVARSHHTTQEAVSEFVKRLRKLFANWDTFSQNLKWEMIYVQPSDSTAIARRQECLGSSTITQGTVWEHNGLECRDLTAVRVDPVGLWRKIKQFVVKLN